MNNNEPTIRISEGFTYRASDGRAVTISRGRPGGLPFKGDDGYFYRTDGTSRDRTKRLVSLLRPHTNSDKAPQPPINWDKPLEDQDGNEVEVLDKNFRIEDGPDRLLVKVKKDSHDRSYLVRQDTGVSGFGTVSVRNKKKLTKAVYVNLYREGHDKYFGSEWPTEDKARQVAPAKAFLVAHPIEVPIDN